jgi:hypothetical protein
MNKERLAEIRARDKARTPGRWAWEYIGEKVNGYVIGLAFDKDGKEISGLITDDPDAMTDPIVRRYLIGEHEASTCNYGDPEFVAHAPQDILDLLAHVEELEAENEALKLNCPYPYCPECECEVRTCDEDGCCNSCGTDPIWPTAEHVAEIAKLRNQIGD